MLDSTVRVLLEEDPEGMLQAAKKGMTPGGFWDCEKGKTWGVLTRENWFRSTFDHPGKRMI
jgi:hypothetical protein